MVRRWWIVALTVGADQLTKEAVRSHCEPGQSIPLIPSVLHLTYVQNTGAAFGLFRGHPSVFIVLSVIIGVGVLLELLRHRHLIWPTDLALSLILGGAAGNLIDRVSWGWVIDFIDLRVWPVFNLADSAITVGVTLLLWQTIRPHTSGKVAK
ncbi:MAG: signal peptidase II [Candidatus Omnitrophica bacterium]|nr:signal peptidase II [Candidatus Omnitrophota bacterium]